MAIPPSGVQPPENLPTTLGRYTLQRIVGRGAAGVVYLATLNGPAGFRKQIALKLVLGGSSAEVVSEARLGALLDHPNIVGIYDLTREGPWWLIAMEWVHGPTLLDVLQNRGAMPGLALQQLGAQIADALDHAHSLELDGQAHPIVHRDLKPSNVLITLSALVKVADLGLATLAGTAPDVPIGTPGYMAPEQLVIGGVVGPPADQFALGILLSEMALGRRMVRGRTVEDVRARHRRIADEIARGLLQRQLDERLPGLGEIVARCLAPVPPDRYPDCGAVRDAMLELEGDGDALVDFLPADWTDRAHAHDDDATSLAIGPSNIPDSEEDTLIGRTNDLGRLTVAVQEHRIVTVHGPGGMGKSALVTRYGATSARRFAGGAWLCDASAAHDTSSLCSAVASALGLPLGEGATHEVVEQVGHQLAARGELVLILDGVDRAIGPAREVLSRWAIIAPAARFVATSRHRLRLPDEEVLEIGPLADTDAVALLQDRAGRAGKAASAWTTPAADPQLTELARRLDGLPLAIELAAARARLLTPDQLLERLDDRFRILGDGEGRTLEGVLQESWDQLPGAHREVMAQLSVFRDGFSVDDAEGVIDHDAPGPWVLDVVGALLDRSLVSARRTVDQQPRFFLYESIRLFAARQLDDATPLALRHARWFARLGRPEHLANPPGDPTREALAQDLSNLEAGVDAAVAAQEGATAAGCAVAAGRTLAVRGPLQRGLDIVRRALTVAPDHPSLCATAALLGMAVGASEVRTWVERACAGAKDPRERADALHVLGLVDVRQGELTGARGTLERALREARQLGNPSLEGRIGLSLGQVLADLKRPDARGMLGYALRLGRRSEDVALQTEALVALGRHCREQDDLEAARRWLRQALTLGEELPGLTAKAHGTFGSVERVVGNLAEAHRHFLSALSVHRRLGRRRSEASSLANLAVVAGQTGNLVEARDRLSAAARLSRELDDPVNAAVMTMNMGAMASRIGELETAAGAIEEARHVFDSLGLVVRRSNADLHLSMLDLEAGRAERAYDRAREMRDAVAGIERGAGAQRIAALSTMARALVELGRPAEGLTFAEEASERPSGEPMIRAMARLELGVARHLCGSSSDDVLTEAIELAHDSQDAWIVAWAQLRIAELAVHERDVEDLHQRVSSLLDSGLGAMRGLELHARGLLALAAAWRDRGPTKTVVDLADALEHRGFVARAGRLRAAITA